MVNGSLRPNIVVAIPAYNEGKYLGSIVLQAKQRTDEVIVIDDRTITVGKKPNEVDTIAAPVNANITSPSQRPIVRLEFSLYA